MDKDNYEKSVLPMLRGGDGYKEEYSSAYEFKLNLDQDDLVEEKLLKGWVFWSMWQESHLILNLFKLMASDNFWTLYWRDFLIQFWGWKEEEGGHRYLSTTNHPFFVSHMRKGHSWYRNFCKDHVYDVDVEAEQLGSVGRAYRNRQPESTPDLRLYSDQEFPLRLQAALCGFRGYLALPLFDLQGNEDRCYGVLEVLFPYSIVDMLDPISEFYETLELAGFRSTHLSYYNRYQLEVDCEIKRTLELAMKTVPRLSLAQVWVPCKQCHHTSQCMQTAYLTQVHVQNIYEYIEYTLACDLHTLQIDVNSNTLLSDDTISSYPLAHYAQRAGFSLGFAIVLRSQTNHSCVIQFFLEPKYKEDSFMLVLSIIKMKLKSFELVWGGKLLENFNTIELESIDMLESMDSYEQIFSESDFTEYLETGDICCSQPYSDEDEEDSDKDEFGAWVFRSPNEKVFHERVPMEKKIQHFMEKLAYAFKFRFSYMVQFWAPIMVNDRHCLTTRDQPYALSCLAKGLASFRKECIKYLYLVDEEAKEDELGPVGRVFRNGHPELLFDLYSYSAQEFSMRTYALHCGIRKYFALPVFDDKHECVGVIELIGYDETYFALANFITELERAELWPPNFKSYPTTMKAKIECCNVEAKAEIENVFDLIEKIPQCQTAKVWVPFEKCSSSCLRCMKWLNPIVQGNKKHFDVIHVKPKIGMIGMVLESETKACFCQNVTEFGITEYALNYNERKLRSKSCFAICLQSSHTGNLLYVLEFFLYQSTTTYDYLMSFLKFLLPVLMHELKSFKIASGKRLGEGELVVEVIEFSDGSQLTFPDSVQIDEFPIKFKRAVYGQKEHEYIEEQEMQSNPDVGPSKDAVASNFKNRNKGKRKMGVHLNLEILKPHFGKKLEDVAEELGVGRSTIKRACREVGINRWPRRKKQAKNPSVFERGQHKILGPSSSSSLQVFQQNTNTQHPFVEEEEEEEKVVMIKVKFKEDVIRFELCLSLGVVKLSEEVARRLNLDVGSFKLKYIDEDNEEILVACDEDLQLCPKVRASTGQTCINLFIPK